MGWLYGTWLGAGVRRVGMAGFTISGVSYLVHSAKKKQQQLPAKIVLNLDLTRVQLVERAPSPQEKLASKLGGAEVQPLLLRDTCSAIRSAAADDRVVGLVAQFGTSPNDEKASLAQCQELADAVAAFRAEKPAGVTIAHADAFSGLQYLLAASFESVYAQPGATVQLPSFSAELPFLKSFLARWGFRFEGTKREQFKNANDMFAESEPSRDQLKATTALLRSCFEQAVSKIGVSRGLKERHVAAAARRGLLSSSEALKARLIDGTLYDDEVRALTKEKCGAAAERVALSKYHEAVQAAKQQQGLAQKVAGMLEEAKQQAKPLQAAVGAGADQLTAKAAAASSAAMAAVSPAKDETPPPGSRALPRPEPKAEPTAAEEEKKAAAETKAAAKTEKAEAEGAAKPAQQKPAVALVTMQGTITRGHARGKDGVVSSGHARQLLRKALRDESVKAVVLRIDSRGGDAVASDAIWRDVQALKKAGKPVVASMGSYAASGGYFIASAADKIVAQPGTITGSIGVVAGKLDASGWLKKQRIRVHPVVGGGAAPLGAARPLSAKQRAWLERYADDIYALFLARVQEGRGLKARRVREVAKGRVWTGEQALSRGLVDELGGLEQARVLAAKQAGLEAAELELREVTADPSPLEVATRLLGAKPADDDLALELEDGAPPPSLATVAAALLAAPLEDACVEVAHRALTCAGLAPVARALLLAEQRGEAAAACADGGVQMLAQMPAAVHVC